MQNMFKSPSDEDKTRAELLQELILCRKLFDSMQEGFVLGEIVPDERGRPRDYRFLKVNEAFCRLTGFPREVVLGRTVREIVPGVDLSTTEELGRVAASGNPEHFEVFSAVMGMWFEVQAYSPENGKFAALFIDITERKKTEQKLQESEAWFRGFMDNSPAIAWAKDEQGRHVYLSRSCEDRFGVSLEDFRGKTDLEVWPVEIAERLRGNDQQVLASGRVREFVEETETSNGERRYWWNFKFPIQDASGHRYVGGIGIDITDSRRTQEALHESERRFRSLVENALDGVVLTDEQGIILEWNHALEKITGLEKTEAVGMPLWDIHYQVTPDENKTSEYRAQLRNITLQFLSTGCLPQAVQAQEYGIQRIDGSRRIVHEKVFPVETDDGFRIAGILRDITEHRRAEEALKKNQQMLARAQEIAHLGGWEMDIATGECEWSDEFFRICGYKPQAFHPTLEVGLSLIHPEDREVAVEAVRQAIEKRTPYSIVKRICRPDGSIRYVRARGEVIRESATEPARMVGSFLDITEQKLAENALHELNATLEQQVAERTAMAENRTRQLQTLAVQLIEAEERERRRIAAVVHDDLQQILAAARQKLQWLKNDPQDESIVRSVDQFLAEAIQKARSLSHELQPAVLQYSTLQAALEWLVRRMKDRYGLKVRLVASGWTDDEVGPVKLLLFRSLQELLFNVVKHAQTLEAEIHLSRRKGHIEVAVSDSGKGLDPHLLDSSGSPTIGIGLLSIRERINSLGGKLGIESRSGRGSRITISIPRRASGKMAATARKSVNAKPTPRSAAKAMQPPTGVYRVLFVDDHKIVRQGLVSMLQDQIDIQVVGEAADGAEAVSLARELEPDVVVMDIAMPQMDGIEATRRIKEQAPQMRIIGLSMIEDQEVIGEMLQAGAEACIGKTASSASILRAIYGSEVRP